jgi:hypothetical protein
METKKKIVHTVIEEIVVRLDEETKLIHFWIHWKGGAHACFELLKPRSPFGKSTSTEALEIIRKMAVRYGDGQIASVLNRNGLRTGKEKSWDQVRVATARRNHGISGQKKEIPDPETLNLKQSRSLLSSKPEHDPTSCGGGSPPGTAGGRACAMGDP